jgi:hypothetical protein
MSKPGRKSAKRAADTTQAKRFIDAAREAGASEDEAVFDENLKRIANAKPQQKEKIYRQC